MTMKKEMTNKTHWLQNPNKNYLGHWDLPNGQDVILTIKSAGWEEVKNPIINTSEAKRVIRFVENFKWLKPFICNEINAQTICKSTDEKFMEDCAGKRIKIGISQTKVKREEIDCLRVRMVAQHLLEESNITDKEIIQIQELLPKTDKTAKDICAAYKIDSLKKLNKAKFEAVIKNLNNLINANNK